MEPLPTQQEDANTGPRPGGTLLRFKKLTNHLFGRSPPADEEAPRKDEDAQHGRTG